MIIDIHRKYYTLKSTISRCRVRGTDFEFFGIEDVARVKGVKIPKETAIAADVYRATMDYSNRHESIQPHILGVPMFEGIRFDIANYAREVEGCIGVGSGHSKDAVWNSTKTHAILCHMMQEAVDRNETIWVIITDEQEIKK